MAILAVLKHLKSNLPKRTRFPVYLFQYITVVHMAWWRPPSSCSKCDTFITGNVPDSALLTDWTGKGTGRAEEAQEKEEANGQVGDIHLSHPWSKHLNWHHDGLVPVISGIRIGCSPRHRSIQVFPLVLKKTNLLHLDAKTLPQLYFIHVLTFWGKQRSWTCDSNAWKEHFYTEGKLSTCCILGGNLRPLMVTCWILT